MLEIDHKQNPIFPNLIKHMHPDEAKGAFACRMAS
jgi:hypothetical protein